MSALALDRRLLFPRPRALLARLAMGAALPLALLVLTVVYSGNAGFVLFGALFIVAQGAAAVTTAHKEVLAAGHTWFHRGLRRQILAAQLVWALLEAVAVVLFLSLTHTELDLVWLTTAFGAALCVHALIALAMLHLAWAFQLPIWLYYVYFLLPTYRHAVRVGQVDAVMATPLPWLLAAGALTWWLGRRVMSPALHRRLHGTFVLGSEDLLRPGRVQQFKRERGAHGRAGLGPAWRRRLIENLLGRATVARQSGDVRAARTWQMWALDVAVSVSTRGWVITLAFVGLLTFMLFLGYYDGRLRGLNGWFSGLAYQWTLVPVFSLAVPLLAAGQAAVSRREGLRAEIAVLGQMTAFILACALLTAALQAALAAWLPVLHWRGVDHTYFAAPLHCIWLAPSIAPFAWLGVALRPRPLCTLSSVAVGPLFLVGHYLLIEVPHRTGVLIWIAASVAALVTAYLMRRRWWQRADHTF